MTRPVLRLAKDRRLNGCSDKRGTVVVKIILAKFGHTSVKGNLSRVLRFENAKVSDVYEAIKRLAKE